MLIKPTEACPNCWCVWLVGPRDSIGYCWHGKVAWRPKQSGLVVTAEVTREEHRAMLEYVREMEALTAPVIHPRQASMPPKCHRALR